jgi:hypothetical protein
MRKPAEKRAGWRFKSGQLNLLVATTVSKSA